MMDGVCDLFQSLNENRILYIYILLSVPVTVIDVMCNRTILYMLILILLYNIHIFGGDVTLLTRLTVDSYDGSQ